MNSKRYPRVPQFLKVALMELAQSLPVYPSQLKGPDVGWVGCSGPAGMGRGGGGPSPLTG